MLLFLIIIYTLKYNIIHSEDSKNEIHSLLENDDRIIKINSFGSTLELKKSTFNKIKKHPKVLCIEEDKEIRMAIYYYNDNNYDNNSDNNSNNSDNNINYINYINNINDNDAVSFQIQYNSPWGLSRISGHLNYYEYIKDGGRNIMVYILDTGIDINNPDFEGRASFLYNTIEDSPDTDEQGHGTHCAGIIGSKTYGIAKGCKMGAIKVLDKNGMGSISNLLEGIDFIIKHHHSINTNYHYPAVVNMSIGGQKSNALNHAIKIASKFNIHFSTAAGNENNDACKFSPSSSNYSLTIGASNFNNEIAHFSNKGNCVDIYAPGVSIKSLWIENKIKELSGTSMATPHISGMMAIYLGMADFTIEELKDRIKMDSKKIIERGIFKEGKRFSSLESLYYRIKTRDYSDL